MAIGGIWWVKGCGINVDMERFEELIQPQNFPLMTPEFTKHQRLQLRFCQLGKHFFRSCWLLINNNACYLYCSWSTSLFSGLWMTTKHCSLPRIKPYPVSFRSVNHYHIHGLPIYSSISGQITQSWRARCEHVRCAGSVSTGVLHVTNHQKMAVHMQSCVPKHFYKWSPYSTLIRHPRTFICIYYDHLV